MKVAIFDVDGTLTRTTAVDDVCLSAALGAFLGITMPKVDWFEFGVSTDQALAIEACRRWRGQSPTPAEIDQIKSIFFSELRTRIEADRSLCLPVSGAAELVHALADEGWKLGLASGAWEPSARLKIGYAGIDLPPMPGTFSHAQEGGRPARREEIIQATLAKITGGAAPEQVVYIGDGVWDARAARELGIGFIGVRHDGQEARLRGEGARAIVRDYLDPARIMAMLHEATPPTGAAVC